MPKPSPAAVQQAQRETEKWLERTMVFKRQLNEQDRLLSSRIVYSSDVNQGPPETKMTYNAEQKMLLIRLRQKQEMTGYETSALSDGPEKVAPDA